MDYHDESQAISRIHRIGQTRHVNVLRFFLRDSIEERILKRRQQRGELAISINTTVGGISKSADDKEVACEENDSDNEDTKPSSIEERHQSYRHDGGVSSSRAITLRDLELLLGKRNN